MSAAWQLTFTCLATSMLVSEETRSKADFRNCAKALVGYLGVLGYLQSASGRKDGERVGRPSGGGVLEAEF